MTPDNGGFMVAGYIVTAVVVVVYAVSLVVRVRQMGEDRRGRERTREDG